MKSIVRNAAGLAAALVMFGTGVPGTPPIGTLAATPGGAQAQAPAAATARTTRGSTSDHATTGIVKSVSDTTLVLTTSGRRHHEMTFQLDPSVHRDGAVAVGSHVSIRYRDDGHTHVATAITARKSA